MGSEASNKMSQAAARGNGENASIGAGPEEFPMGSKFEDAGSPGNLFGDKKPRTPETKGASLAMGLSYQASFEDETPDELGEGLARCQPRSTSPRRMPWPSSRQARRLFRCRSRAC